MIIVLMFVIVICLLMIFDLCLYVYHGIEGIISSSLIIQQCRFVPLSLSSMFVPLLAPVLLLLLHTCNAHSGI